MISQKAKLHNRFDFEIYDTETGETEYAQAENIVLNSMWNSLAGNGVLPFNRIEIGTGTGTLTPTRTTLFSPLANRAAVAVETVYDTGSTAHVTKKVQFTELEMNALWTEVGISSSNYSGYLMTHALITDSEGNPITVNKTDTKIITIYATVFAEVLEPIPLDYTGANGAILRWLVGAASTAPTFRFSTMVRPDGGISHIGNVGLLNGTWGNSQSNKTIVSNLARLTTGSGNGPIRKIDVAGFGDIALPNATFPRKTFAGVALGTGDGSNKGFDFPLAFVEPSSETIYVNGVAKTRGTDYTVRYGVKGADGVLLDTTGGTPYSVCGSYTTFEEVSLIPQINGQEADISTVVITHGGESARFNKFKAWLSLDNITWVLIGENSSLSNNLVSTMTGFPVDKYKYIKFWGETGSRIGLIANLKIFGPTPATKHIEFLTAPASGAAITADFSVEYIPKSSNFVLDIQAEVVFGEEV